MLVTGVQPLSRAAALDLSTSHLWGDKVIFFIYVYFFFYILQIEWRLLFRACRVTTRVVVEAGSPCDTVYTNASLGHVRLTRYWCSMSTLLR